MIVYSTVERQYNRDGSRKTAVIKDAPYDRSSGRRVVMKKMKLDSQTMVDELLWCRSECGQTDVWPCDTCDVSFNCMCVNVIVNSDSKNSKTIALVELLESVKMSEKFATFLR